MLDLGTRCAPPDLAPTAERATIPRDALTRHAVCVGMTGSGKTGLCVGLLESLASAGTPVLALDPKGDLANLALAFPDLAPERFLPWVDPAEAARDGLTVEQLAARTAARWREGLTADGRGSADLAAFRERVDVTVLTPGSEAGVPVDVLTALTRAPAALRDDPEGLREYVTGAASALLGLVGRPADPLTDRPAILLARLLHQAFAEGRDLPLDVLLPSIVDPPFERLGYFPLDDFLPRPRRQELALDLDAVLASPAFAPWRHGATLDVEAWLTPGADGRTPLRVLYLAHLDEPRRMFFVTLLLHAVVAWSRRQPGTRALRALLYFDEVFGYLPPHPRNPPSKWPVLTLMKQARAVGLGVVLCTQNPVDVDYKALSNAGTWLIGRLQTPQDREKVIEGLSGGPHGLDAAALDDLVAALPGRAFVLRQTGAREPQVLRSRHALSFLRGPLTRREIARLDLPRPAVDAPWRPGDALRAPPPAPAGLAVRWLRPEAAAAVGAEAPGDGEILFRPALYARLRVRFDAPGWHADRVVHRLLLPLDGAPRPVALADGDLVERPPAEGRYAPLPARLDAAAARARLVADVVEREAVPRLRDPISGLASRAGEDEAAFRARVAAVTGHDDAVEAVPVPAEADDVRVDVWALVWVAGGGSGG